MCVYVCVCMCTSVAGYVLCLRSSKVWFVVGCLAVTSSSICSMGGIKRANVASRLQLFRVRSHHWMTDGCYMCIDLCMSWSWIPANRALHLHFYTFSPCWRLASLCIAQAPATTRAGQPWTRPGTRPGSRHWLLPASDGMVVRIWSTLILSAPAF
jgi:hypothetical protein